MGRKTDLENALKGGDASNFTTELFRLILKADWQNLLKIGVGYPVEVKMVYVWRQENEDKYVSNAPGGLGVIVGPDDYNDESLEGPAWKMPERIKPSWLDDGLSKKDEKEFDALSALDNLGGNDP